MPIRTALLAALLALAPVLPAAASEVPMTAEEFEAHVEGRTLTFHFLGEPYGIEQYLPGRRVIWAFIGDECQEGIWFPRGDQICFAYDGNPDEQCWHFFRTPTGLRGVFMSDGVPGTELYEAENSAEPLICRAPGVGV